MRRLATLLLVMLTLTTPLLAHAPKAVLAAKTGIFLVYSNPDETGSVSYGTGFCRPDSSAGMLITAGHVAKLGMVHARDSQGKDHDIRPVTFQAKDDDLGVLFFTEADNPCLGASLQAGKSGELGDELWLYGFGGQADKAILRHGTMSSEEDAYDRYPHQRSAQLTAQFGDSGAPVFDGNGKVVGVAVGGFSAGGVMDRYIPIERVRKILNF